VKDLKAQTWRYLKAGAKFTDPARKALERLGQAIAVMAYLTNTFPDKYPDGWIPSGVLMSIVIGRSRTRKEVETLVEVLQNSGDVDVIWVKKRGAVVRYLRLKPGVRREAILRSAQIRRLQKIESMPSVGWKRRLVNTAVKDRSETAPRVSVHTSGKLMSVSVEQEQEEFPKVRGRVFEFEGVQEWMRSLLRLPCVHTQEGRVFPCPSCGQKIVLSQDMRTMRTECLCTLSQIKAALGFPCSAQDEVAGRVLLLRQES
jgi:predicted RNA-binding Zn-ribbon protein involved in translation (DUF1610 family)